MQKRWSKTEIAHLERHASNASLDELAKKFKTDTEAVRRKMQELNLASGEASASEEAALEGYARALELLYGQKWREAAKLFEQVVAETDNRHLADRARQGLETCRRHESPEAGADAYLTAIYEKNRGNLDGAFELCLAQGKEKEDERYAYLLASLHSLQGDRDQALETLATAIRLEPKNRIHAYHDPDFAELRGQEEFSKLVSGAPG